MRTFRLHILGVVVLANLILSIPKTQANPTVLQGATNTFVAFEAEYLAILQPGPTNRFTNIVASGDSGNGALSVVGSDPTPAAPDGFATYQIKFRTAGTYYLHYKWKADPSATGLDPNAGNSFRVPTEFGASPAVYNVSASNSRTLSGGSNTNGISDEAAGYTVTQTDVDASTPLVFKIGTRELGLIIDRFIFSTAPTLNINEFDQLLNSETDTVFQDASASYVAFEAEGNKAIFQPGPTNRFTNVVVSGNSGNGALTVTGSDPTPAAPDGFATYQIKFRTAGTYFLHYKWKADPSATALDPNAGNSFRVPSEFGNAPAVFNVSASNGRTLSGGSNTNGISDEPAAYTVTEGDVAGSAPLNFKIGTRELGMLIDRFIFSTDATLSLDAFDALANSGQQAAGPKVVSISGSANPTNITIIFDKTLDFFTVDPSAFQVSGGVTVEQAVLVDFETTGRRVLLTTSALTPGTLYTVTINDISALDNTVITPNTHTNFSAWRLATGWVLREYYLNVPGGTVADLTSAPEYPSAPGLVNWSRSFSLSNDPPQGSYGVRLSTYFKAASSGIYEFLISSDDQAQLFLAESNGAPLQLLVTSPCCSTAFSDSLVGVTPFPLVSGQSYELVALLKQDANEVGLQVGARLQGSGTPATSVLPLSGGQIASFSNPDLGNVTITEQPASVTVVVGHRATFRVRIGTVASGDVLYFQWQRDGIDIPGAIRRSYTTPPVSAGDNGAHYRCVVSLNGNNVPSAEATLTVTAGAPPTEQPYVGINFTGGAAGVLNADPGVLRTNDTAGAVPQENYNNVAGITGTSVALVDAAGAASPVTVSFATAATYYTGTGLNNDGEGLLFQGYLANTNVSYDVTVGGVPPGNYNLLLYTLGFFFDASYEQGLGLEGAITYPTFHYTAQNARQYKDAGQLLLRASSTNANARQVGNYVEFDNVSPAGNGTFTVHVIAESTTPGTINQLPALSGIQLVKVSPARPALRIVRNANGTVTISWEALAAGYTLVSSGQLGTGAVWNPVSGAPNPIVTAGSVTVTPSATQYYQLRL